MQYVIYRSDGSAADPTAAGVEDDCEDEDIKLSCSSGGNQWASATSLAAMVPLKASGRVTCVNGFVRDGRP